jgi:hypothetical protein
MSAQPLLPAFTPSGALIEAGVMAAGWLELDPEDLAVVERCVSDAAIMLALLMVEADPSFGPRWTAAGYDVVARGTILHEALLWTLTPETPARRDA